MNLQTFPAAPAATIRSLNTVETKETIDAWFNQTRAFIRAIPSYSKYMDLTWTAHSQDETRGFADTKNSAGQIVATKQSQSTQVESLIDLMCTYAPELDVFHIRSEATSLQWIYSFIRDHYGCRRTGRQMLQKMSVLKRREGERLNAYWNRYKGFYAENRIRKDDTIKISKDNTIVTPDRDENGERYRLSSDIVLCLHMAHPDLPAEVEKLLSSKLEYQDLASLEREVFVKANIALEQLDRKGPSVRRTQPPPQKNFPMSRPTNHAKTSTKLRRPTKADHYCSSCLRNPATREQAKTHFIKDCHHLSQSDRDYITKLHDRALQNRLLAVEERDPDLSVRFIGMVESYYGLEAQVRQISPDDLLANGEEVNTDLSDALADAGVGVSVVRLSGETPFWQGSVIHRNILISPSPSFTASIESETGSQVDQNIVVDTGCTGECIISDTFAASLGLKNLRPSRVRSAKLADNTATLQIIGSSGLKVTFCGNKVDLNVLVSKGGDDMLLGMPGAEKFGLIIDCNQKTLTFPNGKRMSYRGVTCQTCKCNPQQVTNNRIRVEPVLLQSPKIQTVLLPGQEVELRPKAGNLPDGEYAIEPNMDCKASTNALTWLQPNILEVKNNRATVANSSQFVQTVAAKDNVGRSVQMIAPEDIAHLQSSDSAQPEPEHTHDDITVDPDELLPPQVRNSFKNTNANFSEVFQSDLPRYNGSFGRVEAVINVPQNLPSSSRLKQVPWYPRSKLNELQDKMDELTSKGALARPQDVGVDVQAVSPSFLVAKKPASKGYRMVTSFGHLACHVKTPPTPITSVDQVLKRLSAWKFLIVADISQAYHQIPLSKDSMKYAGVASPFKGILVYQTAAMGMPGSETALSELTALLFGELKRQGKVETLMDDIYVGADTPEQLLETWNSVLNICKIANVRLGPTKVTIAPKTTKILGWTWNQGVLEIDSHASNRLQTCDPPKTAEGLRGFIGAYRFMAPAIKDHARYLEPLHQAIGDKSKSSPIEWSPELEKAFKRAQESLKLAQPLTMPLSGQPLYMTTDASQTGLGATLHRAQDKAVVRHFSKQLSADKQRWIPCELEALAVGAGLQAFLPFFRESGHPPIIYTDSTPVVMAFKKMKRGAFSASPRVATFIHEALNQNADVRYLSGPTNVPADLNSRNPAPCSKPDRCQVCKWIREKEEQVVRRLTPDETNAVLAGNSPLPFQSRRYWRNRQIEDHTLRKVVTFLKFAATPPKQGSYQQVRRYLQPQHGLFLSTDSVLLAPSVTEFSNTPRYVVPPDAVPTIVSVFHQQFGCLAASPLTTLLRRHFFAFGLDKVVQEYVSSCLACAAKRDQSHVVQPMSSVPAPTHFGEHFASDVIKREKQKILLLRETVTSYTWACLVKNEQAPTLESGLRKLFAEVRPPNATRPAVCRVDGAPALQSMADNNNLQDIGVTLDVKNPANKNGNPVAEKANRELQSSIVTINPRGGKINEQQLQTALAHLNSKPRWSTLAAVELWTSRDMVTGETLLFNQEDIIRMQTQRRQKTHPKNATPIPTFFPGEIVFCNSEGNKLKARDKLIIREDLGEGMYRLDRLKDSGRITRAFLPARDLYRFAPTQLAQAAQTPVTAEPSLQLESSGDNPTPPVPKPNPINRPTCPDLPSPVLGLHERKPTTKPIRHRPIPPAPGQAATYKPRIQPQTFLPFIFHGQPEPEDDPPFDPQYEENIPEPLDSSTGSVFDSAESGPSTPSDGTNDQETSPGNNTNPPSPEQPPQPVPVPRQRSGTYPPPTKRPSNTGDGSRKDPSILRHLGFQQRPKRNTNPPQRITYAKNFKQTTTTHQSKDTSSEEES